MKTTWHTISRRATAFFLTAAVILTAACSSTDSTQTSRLASGQADPAQTAADSGTDAAQRSGLSEKNNADSLLQDIRKDICQTSDQTAEDSADKKEPDSLSLIMAGDILFHTPVAESGLQADGSYNYDALFAQIAPVVKKADLALVNQEVVIGGSELGISGYPCFNAPYELGDALIRAGFNVILHATNHVLDKGKQGLLNCLHYWEKNHPKAAVLGIHKSRKDQNQIYVYEKNGIRAAILNYTYGTNGIPLPEDMPYAVDLLEETRVKKDLAKAKKAADFVIVCPHWGTEFLLETSKEQEYWTQIFLENGADLVIGTHPHVLEPVKWIKGKNDQSMLVYYSLGNFTNWTSSTGDGVSDRMTGGMAQVTLQKEKNGAVSIADYRLIPLVTHLTVGRNGVTTYFLKDYTKKLAAENEIRKQDPNFSLRYCRRLCRKLGIQIE